MHMAKVSVSVKVLCYGSTNMIDGVSLGSVIFVTVPGVRIRPSSARCFNPFNARECKGPCGMTPLTYKGSSDTKIRHM